ncbi:ectoine hydroxylase [Amycolatopsis rubida]|uniref:Ectoine hydroxylase n=1 Tax=Amycolatopsis rubida TaxID=112413 RepID=A0ABX0BTL2_9PSEU|nr:ectoine hydroxylase [Amycolatopsis rubida]MYW93724.1 ectoine hydroxylase [Amycolatopsis rubida]NEC58711.1 ectoine hydroxylase [Amycolatopsis rubida]
MTSTLADRYPTRTADTPQILERPDPAVWGDRPGPLADPSLDAYARTGFLALEHLFDRAEVQTCLDELDRLGAELRAAEDERVAFEGDTRQVRSIFEVHLLSKEIRGILVQPKVVDMARQILGSEVYVHQCRINCKPGFDGGPFHWHSDFETWHAEDGMPRPRAFSISVALTENYPFNGALMIMPGTHAKFITCCGTTPPGYFHDSLRRHEPGAQVGMPDRASLTRMSDEHGIECFAGKPGSATVFDSNCLHGSNGNVTPFPRSNLFVVFNSVENTLVEPFAAPERRPPFIAARDFTPLAELAKR